MRILVTFGNNPYSNKFKCSHCRSKFSKGGLLLEVDYRNTIVRVPICPACVKEHTYFEGALDLSKPDKAHRIKAGWGKVF